MMKAALTVLIWLGVGIAGLVFIVLMILVAAFIKAVVEEIL